MVFINQIILLAIKNHWNSSMKKRIPDLLRKLSMFKKEDDIIKL